MTTVAQSLSASLDRILGTWRTEGQMLDENGSPMATIEGADAYERLGERFVVHRADVRIGDERVQVFEMIGPCDPETGVCITRAYDSSGVIHDAKASVDAEGVWTFRAEGAEATLRLAEDGRTMRAEWVRTGGRRAARRTWMRMRFTRLSAPARDESAA